MSDTSPQLPLALRYPPDQRFDTFVSPAQDMTVALLRELAQRPERRGVYLCGASGTGKTHLLLASCAQAEEAGHRAAYVRPALASGQLREALESLHDFDLIALDGIDGVAGHREDELALFHFHNRVHDAGRALLYAAQAAPDALPLLLPDLRSRLSQCTRVTLDALDDAGRRQMLALRAARRGLQIDAAAMDWLLRRVDRDPASLAGMLDRLDRASLAAKRRITVPFLRQVLEPGELR